MKLYKLTDQDGYTRRGETGETLWYAGKTLTLPHKAKPRLCSQDVIHAHKGLNLALLLNPCHAKIKNPRVWESEGDVVAQDWDKVGVFSLTISTERPQPRWYVNVSAQQKIVVMFAALCAEAVLPLFEERFPEDDRPRKAIEAARVHIVCPSDARAARAAWAAEAAARAAEAAAAEAAAWTAEAAVRAAWAAEATAWAAVVVAAAEAAARAAAWAAWAAAAAWAAVVAAAARAARTARTAARAARTAGEAIESAIDFCVLADRAVSEITGGPSLEREKILPRPA